MSDLINIQTQIEKLQKQAGEIKNREFDKTVQDILAKMQAYGITFKNLQSGKTRSVKAKGKAATKSAGSKGKQKAKGTTVLAAKYRGPNGEAWSGRGLMPRWLTALVAQGKKKEEFAVTA
jgi:DNA-binding protein H-NS